MLRPASAQRLIFRSTRTAVAKWPPSGQRLLPSESAWKRAGPCIYAPSRELATLIKRPSFLQQRHPVDEAGKAEDDGHVSSIEEFEKLAEQGKADIPTARRFLERSRKALAKLPLEKQREEAAKVGAGKVLSWLWGARAEGTRQQDIDRPFSEALCWHITAEGKDSFIWEWLRIETAQAQGRTPDTQWNGNLLAALAAARLYWDESADGAIALFFAAAKEFHGAIHLIHASVCIRQALEKRPHTPCSPSLFDAFLERSSFAATGPYVAIEKAFLSLFHPTKADAIPMLKLCQRQEEYEAYLGLEEVKAQKAYASKLARASYILRLQYVGHLKSHTSPFEGAAD